MARSRRVGARRVVTTANTRAEAITILKRRKIKTTADLDAFIKKQGAQTDRFGNRGFMSRFQALKQLVGERQATFMLNDLALSMTPAPGQGR